MKKILLILTSCAIIFCNHTWTQPMPPATSPFTRTLLNLVDLPSWQSALGITGGGGSGIPTSNGFGTNITITNGTFNGTNTFGTNGTTLYGITWHNPTNTYETSATISGTIGGTVLTGSAGAFSQWVINGQGMLGMQISIPTNGAGGTINDQYWIQKVTDSTHIVIHNQLARSYTNLHFITYPVTDEILDINGHPQGYIGADSTLGVACGNLSFNGGIGGGLRLEDFGDSIQISMVNPGGGFGEGLVFNSDVNLGGPPWFMSVSAPNYSELLLASGLLDLRVGLTNDNATTLLVGNLILQHGNTNSPTGQFTLNGTTIVNVGNTLVTATTHIHWNEVLPNGGTASGLIIPVSITPGTGFAIKSVALDTSICDYWLVNTN